MSSLAIAGITLVCVFGASLLGMLLSTRLPAQHLDDQSKDTIQVVTGLMATLAALVLGLLTASSKGSYDHASAEFQQLATRTVLLDRALVAYGPETKEIRGLLLTRLRTRVDQLFPGPKETGPLNPLLARPLVIEDVESRLRSLLPAPDAKQAHIDRALQLVNDMERTGWGLTLEQSDRSLPMPMLVIVIAWLAGMFVGFGMLAPRHTTAVVALLIGALSVSAAIFLIEELNHPLDGIIHISGDPLRNALRYLDR